MLRDSAVLGLGLRARANGRKTWIVHRRCNDTVVRRTLGALGALTVEDARHAARAMFADAGTNGAPAALPTVRTFAPAFLADCAERWKLAARWAHADGMSRFILPVLGDRRVDAVIVKDVRYWFDDLSATRAESANRALAVLSSMRICPTVCLGGLRGLANISILEIIFQRAQRGGYLAAFSE